MRADFRAFLHHADARLALLRPGQLHDATGRAQARRARAHDKHIELHGFAFHRAPRVVDGVTAAVRTYSTFNYKVLPQVLTTGRRSQGAPHAAQRGGQGGVSQRLPAAAKHPFQLIAEQEFGVPRVDADAQGPLLALG